MFGSGPQARGQLKATAAVRDLDDVRVYSPTQSHREAFAAEMDSYLDASVEAVESSEAALENVDIVITATNSPTPVFDGETLPEGAHVTAMGQYHPEKRELDETTIERSTYVPDLLDLVTQDAGAFIQAKAAGLIDDGHVHAELGDVVAGNAPGRTSPDEITVFDSGGTAIETVAGATLLYERAVDQDLGTVGDFDTASEALTGQQV